MRKFTLEESQSDFVQVPVDQVEIERVVCLVFFVELRMDVGIRVVEYVALTVRRSTLCLGKSNLVLEDNRGKSEVTPYLQ